MKMFTGYIIKKQNGDLPDGPVVKILHFQCWAEVVGWGTGSVPGWGTKNAQAVQCDQILKKQECF